jgi:hypothetical protein
MKRQSAVLVMLTLASATTLSCASSEPIDAEPVVVDSKVEELIGGVPANSAKLNAIGNVGFLYTYEDCWSGQTYTQFEPLCTASLLSGQTVLTAKHCIESLKYYGDDMYVPVFAIGPDAYRPKKTIPIADVQGAPGNQGGVIGYGQDVAAVYLASPVTDVKPLKFAELTEAAIGNRYGVIGFGVQNNNNLSGRRTAGNVHVNALSGRFYELVFGSFEAFKAWYLEYYGYDGGSDGGVGSNGAVTGGSDNGSPDAGGGDTGGGVSGGDTGGGISGGDTGGGISGGVSGGSATTGGGDDGGLDEYLRQIYDTTYLLEGYEAYVGNGPGDAQPCFGDSGSPLVKPNAQGDLVAYAVTSGGIASNDLVCDFGAVYGAFGPEVVTFLQAAMNWQDPCNGISKDGVCDGDVASRCTTLNEGQRRLTVTDCSLFGETCVVASNGKAMCVEEGEEPVIIDDDSCPDADDGGIGSTSGGSGGSNTGVIIDPAEAARAKIAEIRAHAQELYLGPLGKNKQ